ncbi:hypothetical protein GC194_07885 [bacterium]|nr:hypothetical protein [bacterium]
MHLTSIIIVEQTVEQVWEFLSNPLNSSKWDRSIDQVVLPETGFTGLGCQVDTIAPSGMRQSFIITRFEPPNFFEFKLLKSSMFKVGELSFLIEKVDAGTKVTHAINIRFHLRSLFLYPIFLLTSKRALGADLEYLRKSLNENYSK